MNAKKLLQKRRGGEVKKPIVPYDPPSMARKKPASQKGGGQKRRKERRQTLASQLRPMELIQCDDELKEVKNVCNQPRLLNGEVKARVVPRGHVLHSISTWRSRGGAK